MDLFKTKITAVDDSKVTTVEKKRVNWNTGLSGYSHSGKGRKCSIEHRNAVSAALKGRTVSEETRAKLRAANLGKPKSAETLAKLSASGKGKNKGKSKSAETRAKVSAALKGRTVSEETRAKLRVAKQGTEPNQACRLASKLARSKPMMTPNGVYPSHTAVQKAAGVGEYMVNNWMKKWPEHYYYIN